MGWVWSFSCQRNHSGGSPSRAWLGALEMVIETQISLSWLDFAWPKAPVEKPQRSHLPQTIKYREIPAHLFKWCKNVTDHYINHHHLSAVGAVSLRDYSLQ